MRSWSAIIHGQPCSKSNSRQLVTIGGRWSMVAGQRVRIGGIPRIIKSNEALAYVASIQKQVGVLAPLLEGRLRFTCKIFYSWEGPDLDPSLILDGLQGRVYQNDRQIREMHLFHAIDKHKPRAVVKLEEVAELPLPANVRAKERDLMADQPPDFARVG